MGRRSDHTRTELTAMAITAAEELIDDGGMQALTARKVTAKIGYTVGSLYLIFENLDDLIDRVNIRTLDTLLDVAKTAVNTQPDAVPEVLLHSLGEVYINYALSHPGRWRTVFQHQGENNNRAHYVRRIARLFELIRQQLRRIDDDRSEKDIATAGHALWSGVHGVIALALDNKLGVGERNRPHDVAYSLIEYYVDGFKQDMHSNKTKH